MKIIKRSGAEVVFEREKIADAIRKANEQVIDAKKLSDAQIASIVDDIEIENESLRRACEQVKWLKEAIVYGIIQVVPLFPDTAQEKTQAAIVQEVGPGTEKDKVTVVPGDKVIYDKYAGTNLKMDGEDYLILKMSDIIAIVE